MLLLNYKDKRPIYEQLKDGVKSMILKGVYHPEDRLPSIRELSVTLTVNPNTVQRAYRELESEGYIHTVAGKGSFVSKEAVLPEKNQLQTLYDEMKERVRELAFYREPQERLIAMIQSIYKEGSYD